MSCSKPQSRAITLSNVAALSSTGGGSGSDVTDNEGAEFQGLGCREDIRSEIKGGKKNGFQVSTLGNRVDDNALISTKLIKE